MNSKKKDSAAQGIDPTTTGDVFNTKHQHHLHTLNCSPNADFKEIWHIIRNFYLHGLTIRGYLFSELHPSFRE